MWKKYLWIKNLIFLCLLSYLLARIGNTLLVAHLPDSLPELDRIPATGPANRRVPRNRSLHHYRLIAQRNIFNSAHAGVQTAQRGRQPANAAPLKKAELDVELIGTVVGPGPDSFAIIEDQKTRKQELYQVDDTIQDQARIVSISRCRVVVRRNGKEEILECPEPGRESRKRSTGFRYTGSSSKGSSYAVKQLSETDYVIDEQEVEKALGNINQLLTQIRVVPNFRNGKADGFKVFAIKPNSIFAKIGLKNGDVIRKVNDRDITSPDKALQAFQELRDERNLTVEISRRGQTKSLNYEIR